MPNFFNKPVEFQCVHCLKILQEGKWIPTIVRFLQAPNKDCPDREPQRPKEKNPYNLNQEWK